MARSKRNRGASYKPQEYFHGVKSSTDPSGGGGRNRGRRESNNSPRLRERFVGFFIVAVILAGGLLIGYVDSSNVEIQGPSPYEESAVAARVQSYLDGSIFRRFKPFISSAGLLDHVRTTHPDIARTTVAMNPFSPTIDVSVEMRSPALVWANQDGQLLAVDVNGVAYAEFDEQFHADLRIRLSDATQPDAALASSVMSAQLVQFIQNLDTELHNMVPNLGSHTYDLPLSAREVRLKLPNYDVRFSLDRFEQEQALELSQLLTDLNKRKITPTQYIDLRTEDRAYYR